MNLIHSLFFRSPRIKSLPSTLIKHLAKTHFEVIILFVCNFLLINPMHCQWCMIMMGKRSRFPMTIFSFLLRRPTEYQQSYQQNLDITITVSSSSSRKFRECPQPGGSIGVEYWQHGKPASEATTVECNADGEDLACSASIPSQGLNVAHTMVCVFQK